MARVCEPMSGVMMLEKTAVFSRYFGKEYVNPINYGTAFLIGAAINTAQGNGIFFSAVPFVIPLLVLTFSKGSVKYRNRNSDILLQLPGERTDPAFVIDRSGKIVASKGNTDEFFRKHRIKGIHHLFSEQEGKTILEVAERMSSNLTVESLELYSKLARKWYQVQIKMSSGSDHILVWLEEITQRKALDFSLSAIRRFSSEMITSINELIRTNDAYDRVSRLILQEGYNGVFITREDQEGNLAGHVFRQDNGKLMRSDSIKVSKNSPAPVLDSRKLKRITTGIKAETETQEAFESAHPFDKRVKDFLAFPVTNFINYHEGNISIIAFNKEDGINRYDFSAMETLANTARSITYLIDLAIGNNRLLSALEVAEEVQQNLLPQKNPSIEGFDIAGKSIYCSQTGGDYYDFLNVPEGSRGRFSIVVGDVTGHGIEAALLMTTARALIRSRAFQPGTISQVVTEVNRHLTLDVSGTGRFMTLFYLTIDPANQSLQWVRAGHDPAIFYDPVTDTFEELRGSGMALGVDEDWQFEENEKTGLAEGQIILLGTDGIWEAHNQKGGMFGKDPIYNIIRQNAAASASEILNAIIDALNRFRKDLEPEDDVTLVIIKIDEDLRKLDKY